MVEEIVRHKCAHCDTEHDSEADAKHCQEMGEKHDAILAEYKAAAEKFITDMMALRRECRHVADDNLSGELICNSCKADVRDSGQKVMLPA